MAFTERLLLLPAF